MYAAALQQVLGHLWRQVAVRVWHSPYKDLARKCVAPMLANRRIIYCILQEAGYQRCPVSELVERRDEHRYAAFPPVRHRS